MALVRVPRATALVAAVAVVPATLWAAPTAPFAAPLSAAAAATSPQAAGAGWVAATTDPAAATAAPAYLGNGYVGTRVPAGGAGFVAAPVATETHVAGVYAAVPDAIGGGTQPQGSVNLPGWTQLDVVVAGRPFAAAAATRYRQALDLRHGTVTTSATWSVGGRATDVRYDVALDRARPRLGVVRLRLTPRWSGTLQVRDVLGAGSTLTAGALSPVTVSGDATTSRVAVRAAGTRTVVAEAARLRLPAGSGVSARADRDAMTVTRTAALRVRAGLTYEVSKVVGFATSLDARDPLATAEGTAAGAPATAAALAENAAAWNALWSADVVVRGQPALQLQVRAAMFYLLASARPDVDWSISPVGLSAGGYNDHVFWDAETWMYPALLAQHPAEASTVVDYRHRTRDGARRNAERTGYPGLRFAWESALTGDEVTPTWAETGHLEQHVTADVALAQWQYFLATGDRAWLRDRGWPVLSGAADFWAGRAEPAGSPGSRRFHITQVEGPDEQNWPVDDSVYVNATAVRTLRLAARAAAVLGRPAPARWAQVADGLVVQEPRPLGGQPAVRPEFSVYRGQQVKQADVVLLTYPWGYPQAVDADRSALEYYTPRYDPDGPAMTDSVSSIVASQLGGDCASWTYTRRSVDPFVKPPYEQFTEARSGSGVFTFLTGEGGFLQEFLYGYTGLRWREDRLRIDPALPPQLAGGLDVTGVRWQGRVLDVAVRPGRTTLTLRSGAPARIETPAGVATVSAGTPLSVPTRAAGTPPENVLRCRPATAAAGPGSPPATVVADPSSPPAAAVDGTAATSWTSAADPATPADLTVTLAGPTTLGRVTATWAGARPLAPYQVQVRAAGGWRTVATVAASTRDVDTVAFPAVRSDALRLRIPATREGGRNPRLAELSAAP